MNTVDDFKVGDRVKYNECLGTVIRLEDSPDKDYDNTEKFVQVKFDNDCKVSGGYYPESLEKLQETVQNKVAWIRVGSGTIKLVLNGSQHTATPEHPSYAKIKAGLGTLDAETLLRLVDVEKAIEDSLNSAATGDNQARVEGGIVYFNDEAIHNTLAERILSMMRDGFPVAPMLRFLENLMENPSRTAVEELYDFLSAKGLPITEDGHFLAYKGINSDFTDKYTGTIDNSVGQVVEVPRNSVDDNRANQCSNGLHVGHFDYASNYARGGVMTLVQVNPRDAVSVPKDHEFAKLRACRYEVIRVFGQSEELPKSLYDDQGDDIEIEIVTDDLGELCQYYEDNYTRDEAVELAYAREIYRTKELARYDGKVMVCHRLAEFDLAE